MGTKILQKNSELVWLFSSLILFWVSTPAYPLLEDRPTKNEVNNILLPYLIAQKKHPESGYELPATDVWWAWQSQYNMTIEEPISNVMHLAAHNSYNSMGDGYDIFPALAPNQILGITNLLEFGARLIEVDVHDTDSGFLEVFHAVDFAGKRNFTNVLQQIRSWINKNPNEIVYVDIEDATELAAGAMPDTSIDLAFRHIFGDPDGGSGQSLIFTPQMRAMLGRWPSRSELLEMGARVIIFTHRNDDKDGQFGSPSQFIDPGGHIWYSSGLAFRANGSKDPVAMRGNFVQIPVQEIQGKIANDRSLLANENYFLSMQSDGIDQIPPLLLPTLINLIAQIVDYFTEFDANRATPSDVETAARQNINFLKMDFLFGHDEDADLGSNVATFYTVPYNRDDAYEIENDGSRVKRFKRAIWSWAQNDPAVQRQIFQDLRPNDGSGFLQYQKVLDMMVQIGNPAFLGELVIKGTNARNTDRDFAVQRSVSSDPDSRWISVNQFGAINDTTPRAYAFALRSKTRDTVTGRYRWKLSAYKGTVQDSSLIPPSELNDIDGYSYIFSAPVNGLQNQDLFRVRESSPYDGPVWINVSDLDRDGNWKACPCPVKITDLVVTDTSINEGKSANIYIGFEDSDPFDMHTVTIDWGDGTVPEVIVLQSGERNLESTHIYRDDDPSGTPADNYTISVEIIDGVSTPATDSSELTVNNLEPVLESIFNTSPETDRQNQGESVAANIEFSDQGVQDTHTGTINWGDGTVTPAEISESNGYGTGTGAHAYMSGGVFEITYQLSDDDNGTASSLTTAYVTGIGLRNGVLQIVGTTGRDIITINREDGKSVKVHADFLQEGRFERFESTQVGRIELYLCDDDDQVNIAGNIEDLEIEYFTCSTGG